MLHAFHVRQLLHLEVRLKLHFRHQFLGSLGFLGSPIIVHHRSVLILVHGWTAQVLCGNRMTCDLAARHSNVCKAIPFTSCSTRPKLENEPAVWAAPTSLPLYFSKEQKMSQQTFVSLDKGIIAKMFSRSCKSSPKHEKLRAKLEISPKTDGCFWFQITLAWKSCTISTCSIGSNG